MLGVSKDAKCIITELEGKTKRNAELAKTLEFFAIGTRESSANQKWSCKRIFGGLVEHHVVCPCDRFPWRPGAGGVLL